MVGLQDISQVSVRLLDPLDQLSRLVAALDDHLPRLVDFLVCILHVAPHFPVHVDDLVEDDVLG